MAVRPLTCPFTRRSAAALMPAWTLWLFLLALLTLPVLLRLYVGDEPRNEVCHEQSGGDDQDRDGDPGPMLAAAG